MGGRSGGSSSRTGGTCGLSLLQAETDLIPSLPVQDPRLLELEPHDLVWSTALDTLECWHELTVSKFPQGFTFLRLFFALRVHPSFGMETTPPSRFCPGSQRDWSPWVMTDSSRSRVYGVFTETVVQILQWLSRCQSTLQDPT